MEMSLLDGAADRPPQRDFNDRTVKWPNPVNARQRHPLRSSRLHGWLLLADSRGGIPGVFVRQDADLPGLRCFQSDGVADFSAGFTACRWIVKVEPIERA